LGDIFEVVPEGGEPVDGEFRGGVPEHLILQLWGQKI
jgi:hypothetical protein